MKKRPVPDDEETPNEETKAIDSSKIKKYKLKPVPLAEMQEPRRERPRWTPWDVFDCCCLYLIDLCRYGSA